MLFSSILTVLVAGAGYSQSDTAGNLYESLSLKDLLNIKIVSVSKKQESLFEAPLSASVLTKEDILKAGSTSIMEALRLVPGMIVREESNGNYDIQLRGMDNIPNSPFDIASGSTTLVMIDNRPVYSYFRGGTFWETLPVDLNDVERIEVVRGPAAALYGPNAVDGVINIITRQPQKDGVYLVANSRQGNHQTLISNASVGYRFNKQWNMVASGNYQGRDRTQQSYFEYVRNNYLENPPYFINFSGDTVTNIDQRYPNQQMAMNKYAGNFFLNYEPAEKIRFSVSAGAQHSLVQKVTTENTITPLSTSSSDTRYTDFRATIKGLSAQFSYNGGTQATDYDPGRKYDFTIVGGNLEYNYTKGHFSIKPGLSYTSAVYDDRKYSDLVSKTGVFNGKGQITTRNASLRGEYKLLADKLRLVAGFATNTFNSPDTTYISYQFAATYKLNKKQLIRAVYSRAPRSANIFDTYVNKTYGYFPTGYRNYVRLTLEGNKNPALLTTNMFELGYRGSIGKALNIDVELFNIEAKNYSTPVNNRPYTVISGADTTMVIPARNTAIPLRESQQGITVSLTWTTKQLQVKPFITIQNTTARNYAPFLSTPDAGTPNNPAINNIYSGIGTKTTIKSVPNVFGGASVNYTPLAGLNINLSAYYYSSQTYSHVTNIIFNDGVRGIDHINAKLLLNASISYEIAKGLQFSLSGRNLLNDNSREFFKTDAVPMLLLAGVHYEL